jgi:hypothetical protein
MGLKKSMHQTQLLCARKCEQKKRTRFCCVNNDSIYKRRKDINKKYMQEIWRNICSGIYSCSVAYRFKDKEHEVETLRNTNKK